ncbi:hypothetical protein BJV77DRAFT_962067 [Russula vinacea]|nr:hypothetical protein BJV77DRAFT_962067 [Russula vinacea]
MAMGHIPHLTWPWFAKLRTRRRWQPKNDDSPQLRLGIHPIPSRPRHKPPIISTGDPRVHSRPWVTSAVAFRASKMRVLMVVQIPSPFRRLLGGGARVETQFGITNTGQWGIGRGRSGRIVGERRESRCYHRWGKTAAGGGNMTWQGNPMIATQLTHTICISVMLSTRAEQDKKKGGRLTHDVRHALDLTSNARLLRAPRDDALEDRDRLVVRRNGGGQVRSERGTKFVGGADSSLVTESSLTARRAHFNASFSISLDETRGGPGGDGSLGCFRLRRVYGGGCREYGGGGIGLDMDGGWDGGVREGGRERVVMVGWL